jgi:hypothetical protein
MRASLAPGPQAQVNLVRWQLACIENLEGASKRGPTPTLESLAIFYNAFAEVPAYGIPPIGYFLNAAAAKAALERLLTRLLELHAGKAI